jgi:phosphatidate cytidylyltransferase
MTPSDGPDASAGGQRRRRAARAEFKAQVRARRAELERQVHSTRAQLDHANERIVQRTGRNLILAILIGIVFGGIMLLSLILIKELFMVAAGLLVAFTTLELASALRTAGRSVPRVASVVAAVAIVPAAYYLDDQGKWLVVLGAVAFVVLWRLAEALSPVRRQGWRALGRDLAASILVQAYVPFLASFAVLLVSHDGGQWWTLAFIILVVAVDTGAYASGLLFGKHPMAPAISPKKTWEGFAGAAVTSIIAGIILAVLMLGMPWWFGLIFGPVLLLTATAGDLAESLIKRDIGIKDMSSWLPGHGGFLDRLDSILPSAAIAAALYMIFVPLVA